MANGYHVEKLAATVSDLATGPGRIKERLENAATSFVKVSGGTGNLPPAIQAEYILLLNRLSSVKSPNGNIKATIAQMNEEEAVSIAKGIIGLYFTALLLEKYP